MALIDKASLLMVPSTYEDGTLYNVLPSGNKAPDETGNHNGYDQTRADFTFSRGSNLAATRVNANGLIEKGRENIVKYSNAFNTGWDKDRILSATSGQSGYDGTNNAWLILADSVNNNHQIRRSDSTLSGVQTNSVYAKYSGYHLQLRATGIGSTNIWVNFDLQNGTIGNSGGGQIDANIESIGDGWYRCSIIYNPSSASYIGIVMVQNPATDSSLPAFVGDLTSGIFIQNAQAEAGLVATPYLETGATTATAGVLENTPRIDYSSGAGALLLEPQRTNLLANSEYISSGDYVLDFVTSSNNQAISPEGVQNAALISGDGSSADHALYDLQNLSVGTYTLSAFVKKNTQRYIFLAFNQLNIATYWSSSVFDLDTLAKADYSSGTYSNGTSKIEDYENGWYRISLTASIPSATDVIPFVGLASSTSAPNTSRGRYAFTTTDSFYLYGFQCEQASHVSSYVPTYGSAATRGADSCSVTGVSDVIGQTEGTLFGEFTFDSAEVTNRLFSVSGAAWSTGSIRFDVISNEAQGVIRSSGVDIAKVYGTGVTINKGDKVKIAIVYTASSFKIFVNGAQRGSTATPSGSLPSTNEIVVNALGGGFSSTTQNNQRNMFDQTIVFDTALTDAECETLTTL